MYDVIIIGSGPAGLTAAIYTTRADLKTLIVAGSRWGGQLMLTTLVENFPGFPEGIQGPDLMQNFRKQAEHFKAEIIEVPFESGDFSKQPFTITAGGKQYQGKTIIIASGADTMWLGLPNEQKLIGKGVSSCAPCDAFFFKNKNVIVVGGGDSAMEEALVLTKFASTVTIVHRRDSFRASKIMVDRVLAHPKIKVMWNTEVIDILGDNHVTGVKLSSKDTGKTWGLPIDGIFVAIGHIPNSNVFPGIDVDEKGYIKKYTKDSEGIWRYHMATNIDGVFVAGDVYDHQYKQAITAAAYGCMAALEVEKWLESKDA